MELRQIIRSGIAASAVVHLSFVAMLIALSDVHPFAAVAPDSVAVDIVTPDQVTEPLAEPPPPKPKGSDLFDLSSKAAAPASGPPAAASTPAAPPQAAKSSPATPPQQQQAALSQTNSAPSSTPNPLPTSAPAPDRRQPAAQSSPQAQPAVPTPAYTPAQPDLTVQYQVMLGLPQARPGDGFDAAATEKADVGSSPIAEFRRRLKTCATLPKEVAPSDKVAIKLRVLMTRDGRLATEPVLIEASASMKGPLLMQSAISALQSCQPYTMLPPEKYNEWRALDLSFTPQDFAGAS